MPGGRIASCLRRPTATWAVARSRQRAGGEGASAGSSVVPDHQPTTPDSEGHCLLAALFPIDGKRVPLRRGWIPSVSGLRHAKCQYRQPSWVRDRPCPAAGHHARRRTAKWQDAGPDPLIRIRIERARPRAKAMTCLVHRATARWVHLPDGAFSVVTLRAFRHMRGSVRCRASTVPCAVDIGPARTRCAVWVRPRSSDVVVDARSESNQREVPSDGGVPA